MYCVFAVCIKDNTIGLIESIPQTISMVKELAVGAVKGEIDLLTLAKTVLKGAFGDYYHVARYIDTLDPFVSKTDAQVYRYGRAVGSVATDVALALVGATVVDKVADILQSSKAGQKILNLAKKRSDTLRILLARISSNYRQHFINLQMKLAASKEALPKALGKMLMKACQKPPVIIKLPLLDTPDRLGFKME